MCQKKETTGKNLFTAGRRYFEKNEKNYRNTYTYRENLQLYILIFKSPWCLKHCYCAVSYRNCAILCNSYWNFKKREIVSMDKSCIWFSFGSGTSEFSLTSHSHHSWLSKKLLSFQLFPNSCSLQWDFQIDMQSF